MKKASLKKKLASFSIRIHTYLCDLHDMERIDFAVRDPAQGLNI